MNEEEVREKCVQLAEMAGGLAVEVKGLTIELQLLKHYVDNMCGMIESQVDPKHHDKWLSDCKAEGLYTGDL